MGILARLVREFRQRPVKQRYFGIVDLDFCGGVYAPEAPNQLFTVGLLDANGKILLSTRADRESVKADIPDGHGFCLPVPYDWLSRPDAETGFQFKVIETGEVFPKVPRVLSGSRLLGRIDGKIASKYALRETLEEATAALGTLAPGKLLVVGTHEMGRSGAPLIVLEIVRHLRRDHGREIVLLCAGAGGVLEAEFRRHCALVVDDLERALKVQEAIAKQFFGKLAKLVGDHPALINSLCSARLAGACAGAGMRMVSLVHEYPHAFDREWMRRHLALASRVVFPCADVLESYAAEGLLPPEEENRTARSILPQGCYLLEMDPLDPAVGAATVARLMEENHLAPDDRLIVACGTIDDRKGFDWFAALIREYARQSSRAAKTHFLWIGRVGDISLFKHALHDLRQHGVIGHFHHLDEVEDVRPALGMADVFLLCSRIDPFPSVVLEAFASGVPVIGFDKGQGSRDLILTSGFGKIVPYQSHDETVRAIDGLLDPSSPETRRVREGGASFVRDQFLYPNYVNQLVALLEM